MATKRSIRDQIFAKASQTKAVPYRMEDWEVDVVLKPMSGTDRSILDVVMSKHSDDQGNLKMVPASMTMLKTKVIPASVFDEEGNKVFTEGDIAELDKRPGTGAELDKLLVKCLEINGLTKEAQAVQEKN